MPTSVKSFSNPTPEGLASQINAFLHSTMCVVKDIKFLESTPKRNVASQLPAPTPLFIAMVIYEHR